MTASSQVTIDRYGGSLRRRDRIAWDVAKAALSGAAKLWFRYEVHGRENLPDDHAFILSPVHRSNLDTPLVTLIRKEQIRFMGKESLWKVNAFSSWFLTMMGGFPVERETADRSAMNAAEGILARGETLVMFPEGTRRTGPIVQEENMHSGPSFVAGRAQVPIVPVGIASTEEAMPKGKKFIYPVKLVFVIGEPIAPPEQNDKGRVPRSAVKAHTEHLRQRLQGLFDEAKVLRGD